MFSPRFAKGGARACCRSDGDPAMFDALSTEATRPELADLDLWTTIDGVRVFADDQCSVAAAVRDAAALDRRRDRCDRGPDDGGRATDLRRCRHRRPDGCGRRRRDRALLRSARPGHRRARRRPRGLHRGPRVLRGPRKCGRGRRRRSRTGHGRRGVRCQRERLHALRPRGNRRRPCRGLTHDRFRVHGEI